MEGSSVGWSEIHKPVYMLLLFRAVRNLLRVSSLTSLLSSLSSTHNISPLLRLLLSALISAHFKQSGGHGNTAAMETTLSLLDEIPLEENVVTSLIRYVSTMYAYISRMMSQHYLAPFSMCACIELNVQYFLSLC